MSMETRRAPIDAAFTDLKIRLQSMLGPTLVRLELFRSLVRGEEESDIDIAVVVKRLEEALCDRILATVADVELEHVVALSTVLFSEEDFRALFSS
jgi:predicted nucleotidyltransferase